MILKRPFAFFIKHFRLIHFILAVVTMYLTYNTISIISFFNEYMQATATLVDKDVTAKLFPFIIFTFIFTALIISTLIMILLKWKKKPIIFYIISIINNVYVWGVYIYSMSIVKQLEISFIDLRTLKLVRDLLIIALIIQTVSILLALKKSTGFDLKKFNFDDDFGLKVDELDNAEFEFDVDIDTDDFKRSIKRHFRNIKYIYRENKLSIILAGLTLLSIVFSIIYVNSGVYSKIYKTADIFKTAYFNFGVVDSYITSKDYQNNKITKEKLVIVKVRARNMTKYDQKLETAKIAITNGNLAFYHNPNYKGKFIDIGNVYVNEELKDNKFREYLLVYELSSDYTKKQLYLKYFDDKDKSITVKLSPRQLDSKDINASYELKDQIDFKGSLLENTEFTINEIDINKRFKENYKFCVINNDCYNSYEYVVPSIADSYSKVLLKLTGTLKFDDKVSAKKINSIGEFLKAYGKLKYKINGEEKIMSVAFKEVKPKKTVSNSTYLEVYEEIKDASEITLIITVRNRVYNYKIK